MQGDVAPKVWFGTKTFNELPSVGNALFALPSEGSLLYSSLKVLRILKGLFQKSLKQVRTASATFHGAGRVAVPDGSRELIYRLSVELSHIG